MKVAQAFAQMSGMSNHLMMVLIQCNLFVVHSDSSASNWYSPKNSVNEHLVWTSSHTGARWVIATCLWIDSWTEGLWNHSVNNNVLVACRWDRHNQSISISAIHQGTWVSEGVMSPSTLEFIECLSCPHLMGKSHCQNEHIADVESILVILCADDTKIHMERPYIMTKNVHETKTLLLTDWFHYQNWQWQINLTPTLV